MAYTKTYVMKEISFESAVLIYLEGIAEDEKCTLSDIVNRLVKEKAIKELTANPYIPDCLKRVPYRPTEISYTDSTYDMSDGIEVSHSKKEGSILVGDL